ncbi:melanoma inhibitory activity protein 2 isoform X1 [Bufo bufo]|uniref:melanoma inhibitory activity protein 2 isoform X1 n=1 Tax=Bufo bufo TaxID=8384 RepID=UPI001ABE5415|nr:melanoma inhibitory activity protein 2 isoform X1 [Bufo bufo]
MEYLRVFRALVTLVLLFTTQIYSQKILSDRKKCGDPHCQSLMLRVSAKENYSGPDCRFLTFKTGDEINVYYKLTGRREDLWQGSKGKAYGFFPKDAVTIEEVYLSEEMEVPAQETDFVCLDGGEYFFENEDSVLGDIREEPADHSVQGGGHPTEGQPDAITQVAPEPEAPQKESWAASGIAGWFGMGQSNENKDAETDAKNIDLETNLETEPQEPPEEAPPEKSGWLGGRIKTFLPFGGQRDETQSKDNEDYGENASTSTQQTEQEQSNTNMEGEDSKPKWFHFRIREVLGFGAKSEKKEELNLNVDGADNEMISESKEEAVESNLMPDQSEISRPDQTDKTKDNIEEEDTTLPNAQKKDAQAKDEFNILKDKHQPEGPHKDALTKMDSSFQDKGGDYEEEHKLEEEDHSTKTLVSSQADDYQEQVAKNINEYSDTMSQGIDLSGLRHEVNSGVDEHSKDDIQILTKGHLVKPLEALTTEKDKAIQDEDYGEKLRYQEAEHHTQNSQAEDPREHIEKMIPEYSETLSQEIVDCVKHGSVITDDHDKTEVINSEELYQSKITQENKRTMEERSKVTFKRLEETFNPIRTQEQDEDPNLEDNIYLASHHLIDKPESTESTRINQKTKDDTEEKLDEFSSCSDAKEAAGTSCMEPPQGAEETPVPIQSDPGVLAFTAILRKIYSGYNDVHTHHLMPVWSLVTSKIGKVASLLPEDLQPGADFYGCPWDVVIFTALFGFLSVLMFMCRTMRCIKSRFYAGRECKLGNQITEVLDSKREVLEKLSIVQKQYEDVQQKLQESGHQKLLTEISEQKAVMGSLQASNKELEENLAKLERDLEEERVRGSEVDHALAELNEKIKALEEDIKKETSQKEETRTTQKVFEINKGRLESSLQDATEEKSLLEESIKQLSKEAEGWEERFSELSENSRILSSSVLVMQEDLSSKQSQIKSLIENLLSLKDWSSELDEVNDEDDNAILSSIKWDFENGEPLGDPQKQRIKKLIYAAMLNASLKSVESEKKHLCENLSDEMKAKEQLAECIANLHNTRQSLSQEKGELEEEVEKLNQKMSVMMEVYQENEQKLHRKLTVQEKERIQKEAKLSKADKKMNMATSELVTVKTRVSELEEEMEKTVSSYQNQVTSYEKKSHDNWLTARAAERYLSDVKKETGHLRQKLTEAEYKLELLEKDPFALDVMQAIGRAYADAFINHQENSPFGISPINRLPESRAFLSPPTLLEGPLRLSPMLPAADRGVRAPGYYPGYPGPRERGEINADRRADHQRTLSDAGSLSPPWDREQRNNMPPPGLPYPEPLFPPRRAERFYHYPPPSGRFSGPAELTRNQGKPFMDSQEGRSSPEYKGRTNTSRNGEEEANNASLLQSGPSQDNEAMDGPSGEFPMHPPPPMRVTLLPRDPRAPYFRRPLMPPPPMEMYGPPGYPGMPPPLMPMRSPVHPLQQHHYPPPPPFPMHGEAYFSPQPIRPPTRNDPASDSAPPPTSSLPPQDKLPEPTT